MNIKEIASLGLKKKIAVSLVIFVVLIFTVISFVIFPAIQDIKTIKSEIEFQRIELEKKYLKGQNLRNISEKLERAEPKIDILNKVFIQDSEDLKFITTLEEAANKNKVSQKINLSPLSEKNNNFYEVAPLQLLSQGSFSSQINYLITLETLEYYLNIKSLELSSNSLVIPDSPEGSGASVSLLASVDTYWQLE